MGTIQSFGTVKHYLAVLTTLILGARISVLTLYALQQFVGVKTEVIGSGSPSPQARREKYSGEIDKGGFKP